MINVNLSIYARENNILIGRKHNSEFEDIKLIYYNLLKKEIELISFNELVEKNYNYSGHYSNHFIRVNNMISNEQVDYKMDLNNALKAIKNNYLGLNDLIIKFKWSDETAIEHLCWCIENNKNGNDILQAFSTFTKKFTVFSIGSIIGSSFLMYFSGLPF